MQTQSQTQTQVQVLKFGGTSVADAERISQVVRVVSAALEQQESGPVIVVVSALGGVTNALESLATLAASKGDYGPKLDSLIDRHTRVVEGLSLGAETSRVGPRLDAVFEELRHLLHGSALVGESSLRTRDGILSTGELLATSLVAGALAARGLPAAPADSRDFIVTDGPHGQASVNWEQTKDRVVQHLATATGVVVVPGFVASDASSGDTTTLGRGGSDYTASLIGAALGAESVEIWTDVDGVMSADPSQVPESFSLPELSFDELIELAHFGAKVVYAPTIHPARANGVSLLIKNTGNPEFAGTRVSEGGGAETEHQPVRGISSTRSVALLRLQGDGMVGRAASAERLFRALAVNGIRLLIVCQNSSGHTLSFAIRLEDLDRASVAISKEFELEMQAGWIDPLIVHDDCASIAVVGRGMQERTGISGRVFSTLGDAGVNIRAIAQGSGEMNISCVISRADEQRALRALHSAFFRGGRRHAHVYLAGVGRVGAELLEQLERASELRAQGQEGNTPVIHVAGVANSKRALLPMDGVTLQTWEADLQNAAAPASTLLDAAVSEAFTTRLFVDCTSNDSVARTYPDLLAAGTLVVAANKTGFSSGGEDWARLRPWMEEGSGLFYETTVGAGLPLLRTIADLVATGDRIHRIVGALSGTLTYVLSSVIGGQVPLSEAVKSAHAAGMTEPDPRADLSGMDVARKAVILARTSGFELDLSRVSVEPMIPEIEGDLETFWKRLPESDASWARRVDEANRTGKGLSYLATIDPSGASVGIQIADPKEPWGGIAGSDNVICVWSDRYRESPLTLRGPGAGPAVTAAGVFADILRAVAESA